MISDLWAFGNAEAFIYHSPEGTSSNKLGLPLEFKKDPDLRFLLHKQLLSIDGLPRRQKRRYARFDDTILPDGYMAAMIAVV